VGKVLLNGTVKGDVICHGRLELGATARVVGNVFYHLIEMAIGAEINGKLVHQAGGASAREGEQAEGRGLAVESAPEPQIS